MNLILTTKESNGTCDECFFTNFGEGCIEIADKLQEKGLPECIGSNHVYVVKDEKNEHVNKNK